MSKKMPTTRLQVLVPRGEHRRLRSLARARGMSLGAWVREVLRGATSGDAGRSAPDKIAAIRQAATLAFPTTDIDRMNAEITAGYLADDLR